MTTDFRALCAELLDKYDLEWRARERIKAALAAEPKPPADGEVVGPVIPSEYIGYHAAVYRDGFHAGYKHALTRVPLAPQPVPEGATLGEVNEVILLLRAKLRSVTDALEMLLDNGFPTKGRTSDDRESREQWHEDIRKRVGDAQEALQITSDTHFPERLAPQPVPEGPSDAELWELFDWLKDEWQSNNEGEFPLPLFARAVLARWGTPNLAQVRSSLGAPPALQPEPEGPTDKELHQLWQDLYAFHDGPTSGDVAEIARAVLDRWGR
jgi:hypothetical protein